MRTSTTSLATLALVAGALVAPACADHVPTAANACPCATGYVCCSSGVCASDESSCGTATAALSIAAQGTWVGYIENYLELASGSDRVEVQLTVDADGQLQGKVVMGEGPPPPPATAAERGWPGRFTEREIAVPPWIEGPPVEGFPFTARDIKWQARRLRFTALYAEPWGPWCALQRPNLSNPDALFGSGYLCGPIVGAFVGSGADYQCVEMATDGVQTPKDCGALLLCGATLTTGACHCTETTCAAATPIAPFQDPMRFDLELRGNEAEGSLAWSNAARNTVRLIRASR